MIAPARWLLIGTLLLFVFSEHPAMAGETENGSPCVKKLTAVGRPNKIQSLSTMSAVIRWKQRASELGSEFGHWQNALNAELKCKYMKRSGYYICYASGNPCRHPSEIRAGMQEKDRGEK